MDIEECGEDGGDCEKMSLLVAKKVRDGAANRGDEILVKRVLERLRSE